MQAQSEIRLSFPRRSRVKSWDRRACGWAALDPLRTSELARRQALPWTARLGCTCFFPLRRGEMEAQQPAESVDGKENKSTICSDINRKCTFGKETMAPERHQYRHNRRETLETNEYVSTCYEVATRKVERQIVISFVACI